MAIRSLLWQDPDTSGWIKPLNYVGTYTSSSRGGAGTAGSPVASAPSYNPEAVGGGIAKYYGTVLGSLPIMGTIARNIAGVLSPEVRRNIAQGAAERGISIGSYGGGNDQTGLLRGLGLTSQQLQNLGVEQYGQAMSRVPAVSPQSLFISPTDQAQMNLQWAINQANIAASRERSSESEAAANYRARLGTQANLAGINAQIASSERAFAANQAATEAYNAARANELSQLMQYYGLRSKDYDPWMGGVSTSPTSSAPAPQNVDRVYGGIGMPSTGGMYMGPALPDALAEYGVLSGVNEPTDFGVIPDYYSPGSTGYPDYVDDLWF